MLEQKQYTLKQLRRLAGITQEELGKRVGLTARTIGSYENDIDKLRNTPFQKIKELADALDVSVDDIFLG